MTRLVATYISSVLGCIQFRLSPSCCFADKFEKRGLILLIILLSVFAHRVIITGFINIHHPHRGTSAFQIKKMDQNP